MKNKILTIINDKDYHRLTVNEFVPLLNAEDSDNFKTLVKSLVELEDELILYRDYKDRYDLIERFGFKPGIIHINKKGYGFVTLLHEESSDIFIPKSALNGALSQDTVLVKIYKQKTGANPEGEIYQIVSRGINEIIGKYFEDKGTGYVKSNDKNFQANIVIKPYNTRGAVADHIVKVQIIDYLSNHLVEGKVIKVLGHKNDPGIDILSVAYKYNLQTEFPDETIDFAETIKTEVNEIDFNGRRDLRGELIVTIDGEDAKDLDDAVTVKRLENGNYKLGVHIADVSYYVKENNPLDKEAYKRGTSVYLVDRVIPMIPHRLSNGICSLNPHVDRLVISCEMEINKQGVVEKHEIFPAVINSTARMTYTNVNKILVEHNKEVRENFRDLLPLFANMHELFKILNKKRKVRGAINFEMDEAKIIVDELGKPLDIERRKRDVAEKIIEEFMLCANETVAEHFHWLNYPFIYRVHEDPDSEKIKRFYSLCNALGYVVKGKENGVHPKTLQFYGAEKEGNGKGGAGKIQKKQLLLIRF